jgi:hypothetical protein
MATQEEARSFLVHAAVRLGGVEALAAKLDIGPRVLEHYISGNEPVPDSLFLRVIDVVLDGEQPLKS